MPMNRRPPAAVEERRTRVADLYRQGYSLRWIAATVNVRSATTIWNDLVAIRAEWHERAWRTYEAHVEEVLAKLDAVEHAAWLAFERSTAPRQTTTTKLVRRGTEAERDEAQDRRENRDGGAQYLMVILHQLELRCRILGVKDAPKVLPSRRLPDPDAELDPEPPAILAEPTTRIEAIEVIAMIIDAGGLDAYLALEAGNAAEYDDAAIDVTSEPAERD